MTSHRPDRARHLIPFIVLIALLVQLLVVTPAASAGPFGRENEIRVTLLDPQPTVAPGAVAKYRVQVDVSCILLAQTTFPYTIEHNLMLTHSAFEVDGPWAHTVYEHPQVCIEGLGEHSYETRFDIRAPIEALAFERTALTLIAAGEDGSEQSASTFLSIEPDGDFYFGTDKTPIGYAGDISRVEFVARNFANTEMRLRVWYEDNDEDETILLLPSTIILPPRVSSQEPSTVRFTADYMAPQGTDTDTFRLHAEAYSVFDTGFGGELQSFWLTADVLPGQSSEGPEDGDYADAVREAPGPAWIAFPLLAALGLARIRTARET